MHQLDLFGCKIFCFSMHVDFLLALDFFLFFVVATFIFFFSAHLTELSLSSIVVLCLVKPCPSHNEAGSHYDARRLHYIASKRLLWWRVVLYVCTSFTMSATYYTCEFSLIPTLNFHLLLSKPVWDFSFH